MTSSFASFQAVMMQQQRERRTPSPGEALQHFAEAEYSPTPGADASSQSSPGSASDHMGMLPGSTTAQQQGMVQPLYPGASVLAAFEAGHHHVNRVITTTKTVPNTTTSSSKPTVARRKKEENGGTTGTNRRQKRLQRNRESARLSRRRRKQYLEVLEERVDKLSEGLDRARRQHIAEAVTTMRKKRIELILQGNPVNVSLLETNLARTSEELMVSTTFQSQQLQSFSTPPSMQFILWLTLQTDAYFRGGRAASERLSAARIGERVSRCDIHLIAYLLYSSLGFVLLTFDVHPPCFIDTDAQQRNGVCGSLAIHVAPLLQRSRSLLRSRRKASRLPTHFIARSQVMVGSSHGVCVPTSHAVCPRLRSSSDAESWTTGTLVVFNYDARTAPRDDGLVHAQPRSRGTVDQACRRLESKYA